MDVGRRQLVLTSAQPLPELDPLACYLATNRPGSPVTKFGTPKRSLKKQKGRSG